MDKNTANALNGVSVIVTVINLTIFLIMTSFGPSCLLTETIWSERTINTMIFRDKMILAASYVESKNRRIAATTNARSEKESTRFHVSLK